MKRARYVGPHPEVEVYPNGPNGLIVRVQHNHMLPTEDDNGNPIPASFRDSLLEQEDAWSEVNQTTRKKTVARGDKEEQS